MFFEQELRDTRLGGTMDPEECSESCVEAQDWKLLAKQYVDQQEGRVDAEAKFKKKQMQRPSCI